MTNTARTMKRMLLVAAALLAAAAAFAVMAVAAPANAQAATVSSIQYRLYNPYSGEHLYTSDTNEVNVLASRGWNREGEGWRAPKVSDDPIYRLYNPNSGEHHYTTDANEYRTLASIGWNQEGVKCYSDPAENVALTRLFNPYATENTHHYTTDQNEINELVARGWKNEGVGWYGVPQDGYAAEIDIKGYGKVTVSLNSTAAPRTVANFVKLANRDFYDGLTFHRVISGFMVQGGDPDADGTGGSGEYIYGEFEENGYNDNTLSHTRGAISMARATNPNSASSQFFIVHQDALDLDGKYATFGHVTSGMDVIDNIAKDVSEKYPDTQKTENNGMLSKDQQITINSITILDY